MDGRRRRTAFLAAIAVITGALVMSTAPSAQGQPQALVAAAADPVIAAAGDIACDPTIASPDPLGSNPAYCQHRATSDLLLAQPLAAVLPLGDLQYEDATPSKFQQSYHPTWGRVKSLTRPVPGNHEYFTPGATGYFDYFGSAAGPRTAGYYSYDIGSWHVVALNSNCDVVACTAGSAQERWLRADLAANPRDCTLAYFHHPYVPVAQTHQPRLAALWQALYDARADVALTGHLHNYQRYAPHNAAGAVDPVRGIRQFVVGTGGKDLRETAAATREVYSRAAHGVLLMTLRPTGYDWRFAGTRGESVDSGSASCSPQPAPSPSPSPPPPPPPSPSPPPPPCPQTTAALTPDVISAGGTAAVQVTSRANHDVELWAYTRPSTTYRLVRTGRTDGEGVAGFEVRPSANTRLYARATGCASGPSTVLNVRTTLTLAVTRAGPRDYVFSGDSIPARTGGLIVSLYRVEADGRQVLTSQVRADAMTGEWSVRRTFGASGRFGFVVRTGQDMLNAPGSSAVRSTLVY